MHSFSDFIRDRIGSVHHCHTLRLEAVEKPFEPFKSRLPLGIVYDNKKKGENSAIALLKPARSQHRQSFLAQDEDDLESDETRKKHKVGLRTVGALLISPQKHWSKPETILRN